MDQGVILTGATISAWRDPGGTKIKRRRQRKATFRLQRHQTMNKLLLFVPGNVCTTWLRGEARDRRYPSTPR
ncbi:hypothetical protein L596_015119 [Steinernema carpocapsae]|uniref:Uncharacterized protein n=1 Tax=Steinernema carpocapsae TaxID=34508 RepID=A0A4U5NE03_STECR|nr:hypothetical protein L596_015119 [Steinernema carpocapsae]